MLALFAFSSAKTERWTLGITIYACCMQVWTEPKSPCGSVPRTCPRVTQHYFFVFADCFEGGKKATLGEFNTLGISSRTVHLPLSHCVAYSKSCCTQIQHLWKKENTWFISNTCKKMRCRLLWLGYPLNRGRKSGILKHDSSLIVHLATLGWEELPSGTACWLQREFTMTVTDGSICLTDLFWTASLRVWAEPSTTEPQSELYVTVISIIKRSCCWVQAVYLAFLCGRLVSEHCDCSCSHSTKLLTTEVVFTESLGTGHVNTKHGHGLEPALNEFIRASQDERIWAKVVPGEV